MSIISPVQKRERGRGGEGEGERGGGGTFGFSPARIVPSSGEKSDPIVSLIP